MLDCMIAAVARVSGSVCSRTTPTWTASPGSSTSSSTSIAPRVTRPRSGGVASDSVRGGAQPCSIRPPRERIALVLAGGGARGAYEVGALDALAQPSPVGRDARRHRGDQHRCAQWCVLRGPRPRPAESTAAAGVEMWRGCAGRRAAPLVSPSELGRLLGRGNARGLPGADLSGCSTPRRCATRSSG